MARLFFATLKKMRAQVKGFNYRYQREIKRKVGRGVQETCRWFPKIIQKAAKVDIINHILPVDILRKVKQIKQSFYTVVLKRIYWFKRRYVIVIKQAISIVLSVTIIALLIPPIVYFGFDQKEAHATETVYSPSANAVGGDAAGDGFANPTNAYSSDNIRASEGTDNDSHDYYTYGISLSSSTITKVEVGYEACGDEKLEIEVSWDGGSSWSSTQASGVLGACGSEPVVYWDFTSATTWDATKLNDTNFRVRVRNVFQGGYTGDNFYDWIPARITYTTPTTTIGDGTDPGNSTVAPESGITDLDAFSVSTNTGTDSITALTVTLGSGDHANLSEVRVTSDDGAVLYFSAQSDPASETVNFSGGTPIPVTTSPAQFKVRITPKTHANMPAPDGSEYAVTGTVTAFTSTNSQAGTDTDSATITVDNNSPDNVTGASGSAGDTQVSLSWTNPADSDYHSAIVLRRANSAVGDTPVEGTTYIVTDPIGSSTVACVEADPSTGCTDTGLSNGTPYHYKIFAKDSNGNYSATGVVPTGSPFTPETTLTIGITSGSQITNVDSGTTSTYANDSSCSSSGTCAAFTLSISSGSETITSIKITETGTVAANTDLANLALFYDTDGNFSNGTTGQYGSTVANFAGDQTANVTGSLGISSGTTYYFYVRYDVVNGANYPTGSQTVNFQIAVGSDVGTSGSLNKNGAPAILAGSTTVRPNISSVAYPQSPDGGRNGDTFSITGTGFGADCANVSVQVESTSLTCNSATSTSLSVTIPNSQTDTHGGTGSNGLLVTINSTADDTRQTFYVYPDTVSITVPSGFTSDTAREYQSSDTDGIITLNGRRFGSNGTVTVLGQTATVSSWSGSAIELQIPTGIADNVNSGDIVVTRTSPADNKTDTSTGFTILPRILSLSSDNAGVGDTLTISGNHLGASSGTVAVNGASATISSWNDTSIGVTVPDGTAAGSIIITRSDSFTSNAQTFVVDSQITSLSVSSARSGDSVTITGNHFGSDPGVGNRSTANNKVTVNGAQLSDSYVTAWSDTSITVVIPTTGSISGNIVVTANGIASNGLAFTIWPKIASSSISSGRSGDVMIISGDHFGTTAGSVEINDATATITSWSNASIEVTVPIAGIISGIVVVTTADNYTSNAFGFVILPNITSVTPDSGTFGNTVTITGDHFDSDPGTGNRSTDVYNVTIGGIRVSDSDVTAWSDTSVTAKVPSYATTGSVIVRSNGNDSNSVAFSIVTLDATSFTNDDESDLDDLGGRIGQTITVLGSNFGSDPGAGKRSTSSNNITISTFQIPDSSVTAWTNTTITFTVPNTIDVLGGNEALVVRANDVDDGTPLAFFVYPDIVSVDTPDVTGAARESESITINGNRFDTEGTIKILNTTATATSWSDTAVTVTLPSAIDDDVNLGDIVLTREVDSKTDSFSDFRVLPEIISLDPDSGPVGTEVTISGNHFCQAEICPLTGERNTATSNVTFNEVNVPDASITNWTATTIIAAVPDNATTGPVVVKSNNYESNGITFSLISSSEPTPPTDRVIVDEEEEPGEVFIPTEDLSIEETEVEEIIEPEIKTVPFLGDLSLEEFFEIAEIAEIEINEGEVVIKKFIYKTVEGTKDQLVAVCSWDDSNLQTYKSAIDFSLISPSGLEHFGIEVLDERQSYVVVDNPENGEWQAKVVAKQIEGTENVKIALNVDEIQPGETREFLPGYEKASDDTWQIYLLVAFIIIFILVIAILFRRKFLST